MLQRVLVDCLLLLRDDLSRNSEIVSRSQEERYERYCITSATLSQGVLIMMKKITLDLEKAFGSYSELENGMTVHRQAERSTAD